MTEYYSSGIPVPEISPEEQERVRRIKKSIDKMESQDFFRENSNTSFENLPLCCHKKLNNAQKLAVTTIEGPLLVIAGAGSGKTHTLTNRVAFMLEKGIPAHKILLLTFTKKAAMEMKRRVCKIIPQNHFSDFTAGTFHSFANLMMRQYSRILGIPTSFSIIDTTDSSDLIGMIIKKKNFTSSKFPRKNTIAKYISRARNFEKSVGDIAKEDKPSLESCLDELEETASEYERYKRTDNLMDYDDLLEIFLYHLKNNKLFLEKIQQRFSFILVDEYQDTNIYQKNILNTMASEHRNIMVVGDDCQSIYGFRGACIENILLFHEDWPDAKLVKLEQNYRSSQEILDFTNAIVSSSITGYEKNLFSEREKEELPQIRTFQNAEEEAGYIADKISSSEKKYGMKNIAVLYRSSYHGNFIQAELFKQRISFVTRGGLKFNERMHVKDSMAYLRAACNPCDQISWSRILRIVPGIGNITTSKILSRIRSEPENPDFSLFKNRKFYKELSETTTLVKSLSKNKIHPQKLLDTVYSHYFPYLERIKDDAEERFYDLEILREIASGYKSVNKFLSDFMLEPPDDSEKIQPSFQGNKLSEKNIVTLSTIHSAKGLEWDMVIVPHLLDGLFPSFRSMKKFLETEEERRLFYVACSRAGKELILTLPRNYYSRGKKLCMPSRYLREIPPELYRYLE